MTVTPKLLIAPKQAESSQTTQYTATGAKAIIDKFTATNTSLANATLSVNLVNSAGSVGNSNLIVKERTIAPSETYSCPELVGQILEPGQFISTMASTASAITIRCTGREIG